MSGGMAVRAAVLDALRADVALGAAVNAVFDGPQGQASPPFVRLDDGVASDWGAKGLEAVELQLGIAIVDATEMPARIAGIIGLVDAAVKRADAAGEGWRMVTAVMLRSRVTRGKDGRWTANVAYRLRAVCG